jgi:hypothetical protein
MPRAHIPQNLLPWFEARKKFHLTHAQVQMARALGLNPKKFGGLANHRRQPWKLPLPQFIEELYLERFGVPRPAEVLSLEEFVSQTNAKKEQKRIAKQAKRDASGLLYDGGEG